ncbi:MAG: RNA polymerase sigma factor [Candidatus Paceibacterota bacterium]|jgi:RNA polymerase sigma-70 factor (ECF subfamily)
MDSTIQEKQFTQLYAEESDSIFRFCYFRTSDRDVAIDLMQETFLRYWEVLLREGKKVENKRAFLFTIARHCIIDWYRKKKTLSLDALVGETDADVEVFMETTVSRKEIEMEHEARFLMEKIRDMDPLYQQVVYLNFVEGLAPKEIADIVGESSNTISVRIHRGIKQLRKLAGYDETHHHEK